MVTVPTITKEIIDRSEYIKDGISQNLINLSELARKIKPEIESTLKKNLTEGSIIMALKRYSEDLRYNPEKNLNLSKHYGEISLKSGVFEVTYSNSETLYKLISKLLDTVEPDQYFTFIKGMWQTTIIASVNLKEKILKSLENEKFETQIDYLTAITLKLTNNHIEQPGVMSYILSQLSWEGINIIEVVSTWSELTVIIKDEEVNQAFQLLQKIIQKGLKSS